MPKVEAPIALIHDGAEMVLRIYLDRANAETERVTRQRDAVAKRLYGVTQAGYSQATADALLKHEGLKINADGTVTEIDRG